MFSKSMSIIINWLILSIAGVIISWALLISQSWAQTYVSGKVITADGMVVASGAVALEKGELHNNAFLAGGAIGPDGTFKIPLPSGGPWGLHVYSQKYIYFPLQIQITAGADNDIPVILPVDGATADEGARTPPATHEFIKFMGDPHFPSQPVIQPDSQDY